LKYTESLDHATKPWKPRQLEALKEVGLYKDPDNPILRAGPLEQLSREHMTAALAVLNGAVPRACFVGIGPCLNRRVQAAFRVYANELLPIDGADKARVPFQHFTLEAFIDAIDVAGAQETAERLWQRYCNFQRIYDASLSILAPKLGSSTVSSLSNAMSTDAQMVEDRKHARPPTVVDVEAAKANATDA
jgi:hypothetical protein